MITMARPETLRWNSAQVAALMDELDITSRSELAKRLPTEVRSTLYRTFDDDWCGEASVHVLIAMCRAFDVPLGRLVHEPRRRR